ncbi:MAG: hypothetical protein K0Q64_1064 [Nitrobacter vulgaris]|jgi:hypothetical protein|nr:hypothetical protein [Nitrobacter vulgaris]
MSRERANCQASHKEKFITMDTQPTQTSAFGYSGSTICTRCHRPLSDPVSVQAGMGPVCRGWTRATDHSIDDGCTDKHDLPWDGDIRIERRADGIHTNLPVVIRHHSPTGIEWGYAGSGPADLALSILAVFLPGERGVECTTVWSGQRVSDEAFFFHQAFKMSYIATLPPHGGTISGETIRAWIARYRELRSAA